jgi:hypothetical protein
MHGDDESENTEKIRHAIVREARLGAELFAQMKIEGMS